ncbi:MAG: bifunctional UDP-N-acetylmuramoyl-tripeptide:D-alanyl-D-alanine ligase/alanine racemase [Bacteroidales bacterium]|nr:bifunctional UDP-N-acetylmuramoyl-tripeptide:D-alanyl-D-alanine ligase/alanine racemase [Bacteroidales bacterium]
MFSYTLGTIAQELNARLVGDASTTISLVLTDSRTASQNANALFFAIVGDQHDGHDYIVDSYARGIGSFVVSKLSDLENSCPDANFLVVDDTLKALQQLAAFHRKRFTYPVIGITGSNGKTIVKEWLSQLLAPSYSVIRSPKSYNSQVGVPLSALYLSSDHSLAILEAGISQVDEMQNLQAIVDPTIGVFTNIGFAHQENFFDLKHKVREKMKLFSNAETLIYCTDYERIHQVAVEYASSGALKLFGWSRSSTANVKLHQVYVTSGKSTLTVSYKNKNVDMEIPFTDEGSVENAMHCICTMLVLGFSLPTIALRMANLQPVAMRLELKEGTNGCTIINDSYNSDLGSLSIALDHLAQQLQHSVRVLILSDILQNGQSLEALYTEVANLLTVKGVDQFVGVGPEISRFTHLFPKTSMFFATTEEFIQWYTRSAYQDAAILLKGSRPFRFERISALLEQKTHHTILEINLNSLVSNLNYFRNQLNPNVKVMAMVKAYSYGSGSHEIASLLQFHRVDYLGVAFTDEGIALRENGIAMPIIVLNPAIDDYELMIEYNLEPEIFSFTSIKSIISTANRQGVSGYPIHLKFDTGMHRLGFIEDEVDELVSILKSNPSVRVQSIFSHLAASDDSNLDDFTNQQIQIFTRISKTIAQGVGYMPIRHILNSAGIERFSDAQFDMVRLGIGLYGISTLPKKQLQVVNTLKTYVAQVKSLDADQTIGYNRAGRIERPSTIATIPIGYADGLNRRLSNGKGQMMINGKFAPIVGNISMDTCSVDITDIEGVKEGSAVIVFGDEPSIVQIANQLETIPYEVLTSVSRRVKRVYVQE